MELNDSDLICLDWDRLAAAVQQSNGDNSYLNLLQAIYTTITTNGEETVEKTVDIDDVLTLSRLRLFLPLGEMLAKSADTTVYAVKRGNSPIFTVKQLNRSTSYDLALMRQLNSLRPRTSLFPYFFGRFTSLPVVHDDSTVITWALRATTPQSSREQLVMEYIEEHDTMSHFVRNGEESVDLYLFLYLEVLKAMAMAYDSFQFVHGNLTCHNVILRKVPKTAPASQSSYQPLYRPAIVGIPLTTRSNSDSDYRPSHAIYDVYRFTITLCQLIAARRSSDSKIRSLLSVLLDSLAAIRIPIVYIAAVRSLSLTEEMIRAILPVSLESVTYSDLFDVLTKKLTETGLSHNLGELSGQQSAMTSPTVDIKQFRRDSEAQSYHYLMVTGTPSMDNRELPTYKLTTENNKEEANRILKEVGPPITAAIDSIITPQTRRTLTKPSIEALERSLKASFEDLLCVRVLLDDIRLKAAIRSEVVVDSYTIIVQSYIQEIDAKLQRRISQCEALMIEAPFVVSHDLMVQLNLIWQILNSKEMTR